MSEVIEGNVKIDRLNAGDGKTFPKPGDLVTIHYTGTLENGQKFDSSLDRGSPFQCNIGVGQVIRGWDVAIPKLSVGEKARYPSSSKYNLLEASKGATIPSSNALLKLNPVDNATIVINSIKDITAIDKKFVFILLLICLVTNILSLLRYIFLLFLSSSIINPAAPKKNPIVPIIPKTIDALNSILIGLSPTLLTK